MGFKWTIMELNMKTIKSSEITPEHIYLNRREFLKSLGIVSASASGSCSLWRATGIFPSADSGRDHGD